MSESVPQFKVKVIGDGTQSTPYKWELFRRSDLTTNWPASPVNGGKGSGPSRADCIAFAYSKARAILEEERSDNTVEEIEFDVELDPRPTDVDELDSIPVVEPERDLRMENRND